MRIVPKLIPKWPKLAWVARMKDGSEVVEVQHGPMVEVSDDWLVEAVWAGEFTRGDFDRTDLVFGTGIRCRGDEVNFVTAGTVFDRIWHRQEHKVFYASNSLPALLAFSGRTLRDQETAYASGIATIVRGLKEYVRSFPTDSGSVNVLYYNNLVYDGKNFREAEKPDSAPSFKTFADYQRFLLNTASALASNLRSAARTHKIVPLASISSGYDSPASAVIARHLGCRNAVTIKQSTSVWRRPDSGEDIAKHLGMPCATYNRTAEAYPLEEAVWAAVGRPGILNWTLFNYPEPLCLFFTGCHGEKMWDRVTHDAPDPFVRRDTSSLGFCEFRLLKGVFQCVVPFWGVRHSHELKAITLSSEMRPWAMFRDHDKPIARRIVEETGVPRQAFGAMNKNTSLESGFLWPRSPECQASFRRYLRARGVRAPSRLEVRFLRRLDLLEQLVYLNLLRKLGLKRCRPWQKLKCQSLLFQWGNAELKRLYEAGLRPTRMRNGK